MEEYIKQSKYHLNIGRAGIEGKGESNILFRSQFGICMEDHSLENKSHYHKQICQKGKGLSRFGDN